MSTMDLDAINLDDAVPFTFTPPSDGIHVAYLQRSEFGFNSAGTREQFTLIWSLAPDDPDSPNAQVRTWLGWPHPEDHEIFWGKRTAYGAKIAAIQETLSALGGQESGGITKEAVGTFLANKEGAKVKLKLRTTLRKAKEGEELDPNDPRNLNTNVDKVMAA